MNLWLPFVFGFLFQTLISATINHIAHILLSLSRLGGRVVNISFGQERGLSKIAVCYAGDIKTFCHCKKYPLPPPPPLPPCPLQYTWWLQPNHFYYAYMFPCFNSTHINYLCDMVWDCHNRCMGLYGNLTTFSKRTDFSVVTLYCTIINWTCHESLALLYIISIQEHWGNRIMIHLHLHLLYYSSTFYTSRRVKK